MELVGVLFDEESRDDLAFDFDVENNLSEHMHEENEGQAPSAFRLVAGGAAPL